MQPGICAQGPGAGGTGTESYDPIPCPDLGTCTAVLEGTTCVRTCTPRFTQYEAKTSADLGVLIVAKCNVFDGSSVSVRSERGRDE
jgi:hypothetical protein